MIQQLKKVPLPKQSPGFTLIEILVVLVILGVLAGFALLTLPGTNQEARGLDQLRQTLRQLCLEAVDQGTPLSIQIARGQIQTQIWTQGWQDYESLLLGQQPVPEHWGNVTILQAQGAAGEAQAERLICSADGELTPARILLTGAEPLVILAGNGIVTRS